MLDHAGKEGILYSVYKERLGTSKPTTMKFDLGRIIHKVDGLEASSAPFTHDEIDAVVRAMPPDRAPGPDGFNGHFLKCCWSIIKDDFYKLCDEFYDSKLDIAGINEGFITLILKIASPETANEFRPITLLNCCLKIVTKLLANLLRKYS